MTEAAELWSVSDVCEANPRLPPSSNLISNSNPHAAAVLPTPPTALHLPNFQKVRSSRSTPHSPSPAVPVDKGWWWPVAWPNRATRLSQSFHGNSLEESRWPNVSLRNHHSGSHSPSPSKCETKRRGEPFSLASNGTGVALAAPRNLASPSQHVVCCRSFPRVSTNCLVWPGHGGSPLLRDREDAVRGEVQAQVSTARNGGIGSYRSCNCPLSSPDWMPLTTAVQRSLDIEYRACRSTDLPKLTSPMAADWPSLSTNHRGPSLAQDGVGCLPAIRTTMWKWVLLFIVPGAIYCPSAVSGTGTVFPPARCTRSHASFLLAYRCPRRESPHQQMPVMRREAIHLPLQVDKLPTSPRAHLHPMPSDRHCFGPAMTRPLIDGRT